MIYIFDIDGTIADISHRLHFIGAENGGFTPYTAKKDWYGFFKAAVDDRPIEETLQIARALAIAGHDIVYSTGRMESIRDITEDWLMDVSSPVGEVYMRKLNDHREDSVVKSELLDIIISNRRNCRNSVIGGAFEDRQQVVDMYRARGIRVFQVAKGDF